MIDWENLAQTSKCPSCGSPIKFDALSGKLACSMCGNHYNPGTINIISRLDIRDTGKATEEDSSKHEIVCDSCGAVMITDRNTSASFCSFCGSPALITRRLSREFKPDVIIPFSVTKDEAKKRFIEWASKCKTAPRDFTSEKNVDKLTGIYVPFWLIDATCHSSVLGTATDVKTDGNKVIKYIYAISRDMRFNVKGVPFDGSKAISNILMEAIEPFDYSKLRLYSDSYIPGFYAERYDLSAVDMADRIDERLKGYGGQLADMTQTNYTEIKYTFNDSYIESINQRYALLPIWFMNYRYKGLNYSFAVNGQTGEAAGDIPFSKWKMILNVYKALAVPIILAAILLIILAKALMFSPELLFLFLMLIACLGPFAIIYFPKYREKARDAAFYATNPIDSAPDVSAYYDTEKKVDILEDDAKLLSYKVFDLTSKDLEF